MMKPRTRQRFEDLPLEAREQFAENTKERIYSTITLLAVITALWHGAVHHTQLGALAAIVATVIGLWLATLMAARMSYRAIHARSMPIEKYRQMFFSASGLLTPAIAPIFFVLLSAAGMFSLQHALIASMAVLLLSMFFFSVIGSRRIYDSLSKVIIISVAELGIGLLVVAIKLLAGE